MAQRPLKALSRKLRKSQTEVEGLLWAQLRANRLDGLVFRRQEPIGPFVCDFVCHQKRLVVEVDGSQHNEDANIEADARRSAWLQEAGYRVVRYWNHEVSNQLPAVLQAIVDAARLPFDSAAGP